MIIAVLAQVFILVGLLTAAYFLLRRGKGAKVSACAHCAYPTGDITRLQCPECGQDLRVVGIVSPRMRARMAGSYAGAAVGWTLLVLMLGGVASSLLAAVLPAEVYQVGSTTYQIAPTSVAVARGGDAQAASVAPLTLVVEETLSRSEPRGSMRRSVSMFEWGVNDRRACAVELLSTTARLRLGVTGRGVDLGAGPIPFEKIERQDVADVLAAAGIAPMHPALLDDLTRALRDADTALVTGTLAQSANFMSTGGSTTSSATPAWSVPGAVLAAAAAFALWVWGLVTLARRMRINPIEGGVAS